MGSGNITAILAFILVLIFPSAFAACTVKDDAGLLIHLNSPARRIVSLAPDMTEILFAIGADKQIAGVMSGSDYPPAALRLPVMGSHSGLDLERILSLHPDLIITWSHGFSRPLTVLKKMGIPVYTAQPRRLEDVAKTMKNLGCLTGTEVKANQAALNYSQRLAALRKQYQTQKTIRVFYQISTYSLMTINKESWIHEALALCGGRNIFADAMTIAPEISWESVVMANPQVIMSGETGDHWKRRWQRWPEISAVKNQLLFSLDADLIHRAGPRLVEGVSEICQYLNWAGGLTI